MSDFLQWANHALALAVPFWAGCLYWKWVETRRRRRSATALPTREEVERVIRNAEKAGVPTRHVERPR